MPNISQLIDQRELLDFSQNFSPVRAYTGSRLFPDRKTQYIEQEYTRLCRNGNLPMAASVHAFDTEAKIGSRIPFETVTTEELLIKEKIDLTESVRRITGGMDMAVDALREYVFDDVARMAESVVTRTEVAKMDVVSKGKFTIEENGLKLDVDYGIPADNMVKASGGWSADADILGDVRKWRLLAVKNGSVPNVALTSEAVVTKIMANTQVQKAIFGTSGTGILPSMDQINALFQSQFGLTVTTDEDLYAGGVTTVDGKPVLEQKRFFPEDRFVLISTGIGGSVGTGLWGVTPEEEAQGGAFDAKRQQQYVTVVSWDTPDPVTTWTKVSGLFVPVLPNPYGHVIATVAADGTEG